MRVLVILCLTLAACAEGGSNFLRGGVNSYPTAARNYEAGQKALKNGNWLEAIQYFTHIKANFGFSKWATLAELGIADANLGRDKPIEAIDGYKNFIKAHPSHQRVQDGYAAFKIGEAYYKQIPSDFFILPPSYEKDQGPVLDAVRELTDFGDQYADSPYAAEGRKLLGECKRRLADHELYVARYYLDRGRPYAAIGRLEGVIKDYPGIQREPEALLLLGRTYLKMEKVDRAREIFTKLSAEWPEDYRAGKAKLYIEFIDGKRRSTPAP